MSNDTKDGNTEKGLKGPELKGERAHCARAGAQQQLLLNEGLLMKAGTVPPPTRHNLTISIVGVIPWSLYMKKALIIAIALASIFFSQHIFAADVKVSKVSDNGTSTTFRITSIATEGLLGYNSMSCAPGSGCHTAVWLTQPGNGWVCAFIGTGYSCSTGSINGYRAVDSERFTYSGNFTTATQAYATNAIGMTFTVANSYLTRYPCITIGTHIDPSVGYPDYYTSDGYCSSLIEPPTQCEVTSANATIDFQTFNASELNPGRKQSTQVNIQCTGGGGTVNVSSNEYDNNGKKIIKTDDGDDLYAIITADVNSGEQPVTPAGQPLTLLEGSNPLTLFADVRANLPQKHEGPFSNTSVITLTYQ